ncbi:hypothetical protein [uncultured Pseudomonas sp.]|uniref:hypothetical protein n=1 Tax=uncultured Pseudomonas sp. TaxID=114707 RepID=UPI002591B240|nr:hypothetical protein [uncultured Pseudomonas sp.]
MQNADDSSLCNICPVHRKRNACLWNYRSHSSFQTNNPHKPIGDTKMTSFNQDHLNNLKSNAEYAYKVGAAMESTLGQDSFATISFVAGALGSALDRFQDMVLLGWRKNVDHEPTLYPNGAGFIFHMTKPAEQQADELKVIIEKLESDYKANCAAADNAAAEAEEARILAEVTATVDAEIEQERQTRIEAAKAERMTRIIEKTPTKPVTKRAIK